MQIMIILTSSIDFRDFRKRSWRCQSFSQEEKEKKQQYGREQYRNLAEDEKQKLIEYRKKYFKIRKPY